MVSSSSMRHRTDRSDSRSGNSNVRHGGASCSWVGVRPTRILDSLLSFHELLIEDIVMISVANWVARADPGLVKGRCEQQPSLGSDGIGNQVQEHLAELPSMSCRIRGPGPWWITRPRPRPESGSESNVVRSMVRVLVKDHHFCHGPP